MNFTALALSVAISLFLTGCLPHPAGAEERAAFVQEADAGAPLLHSSRQEPDGSDYDGRIWDDFIFAADTRVSVIAWQGGHDPKKRGAGGPATAFIVAIHPAIAAGIRPDVTVPPLATYRTADNAGETAVQSGGQPPMFRYRFTLPQPFPAKAGIRYWLRIEAVQQALPDWGIAAGTDGNDTHFRKTASGEGDGRYQAVPGDAAFTLFTPAGNR
ncbi:MAG: hypothetical protein AB1568_16365 [Thermodesulfobacteriota bacterium]